MDQKRLIVFFVISLAILIGFQQLQPKRAVPVPGTPQVTQNTPTAATPGPTGIPAAPGAQPAAVPPPARDVPRLAVNAPRIQGSINLMGARFDDLVLRDYHMEVAPTSPLVRLLEPRVDPQPYYAQFGWTGDAGLRVPDGDAVWTASAPQLTTATPVTLSWDNGAGQVFEIALAVDGDYVFTAEQRVRNTGAAPVVVHPWARIRRDYKPVTTSSAYLHEGLVGVLNGKLEEETYDDTKKKGEKAAGLALEQPTTGGWAGITDKYWLTALIPDQAAKSVAAFRHTGENNADQYQVDVRAADPVTVAPGGTTASTTRLFAGAKELRVLTGYEQNLGVAGFDKAVDFGWFPFLTRPIFVALDWLYQLIGNFGLAILAFTVFVKAVFFPLANYSYRSMSKMKLLGPKMTEIRERMKDNPQEMQKAIMGLYKTEGVNPASGCLPILVTIPVFICLNKVITINIEMRHAPFFGWIKDLSSVDPTNVFNLFGLVPFDPAQFTSYLHLGIWPLILGVTMWAQQRLNPPPPDPVQARIFQFMPIIFTFMMAGFPAGLVIYWTWNNLLTIAQQWTIMRRTSIRTKPVAAPT